METRQLPSALRDFIQLYYMRVLTHHSAVDQRMVYKIMPTAFRTEVVSVLVRSTLEKVNIFSGADQGFISFLLACLQPQFFVPGQYIYRAGEMGNELFLIHKGQVERLANDDPNQPGTFTLQFSA